MNLNLDSFSKDFEYARNLPKLDKPIVQWWKNLDNLEESIFVIADAHRRSPATTVHALMKQFPKQSLSEIRDFMSWCTYQQFEKLVGEEIGY